VSSICRRSARAATLLQSEFKFQPLSATPRRRCLSVVRAIPSDVARLAAAIARPRSPTLAGIRLRTVARDMPAFAASIAFIAVAGVRLRTVARDMPASAAPIALISAATRTFASKMTESLTLVALRRATTSDSSASTTSAAATGSLGTFAGKMADVVAIVADASPVSSAATGKSSSVGTIPGDVTLLVAFEASPQGAAARLRRAVARYVARLATAVASAITHLVPTAANRITVNSGPALRFAFPQLPKLWYQLIKI